MESFVALAIVLTSKALFASRPLALERSFLIMTPEVTLQVEMTSKRGTASRHGAHKRSLAFTSSLASLGRCWGGDLLTLDFRPLVTVRIEVGGAIGQTL